MDPKQVLFAANKICGYYEHLEREIQLEDIGALAREALDSDIHVFDRDGLLVSYTCQDSTCALSRPDAAARVAKRLSLVADEDITVAHDGSCPFSEGNCNFAKRIHAAIPLVYASRRIGTLICTRDGDSCDELYRSICKILATLCAMALYNSVSRDELAQERRSESAQQVISSLSYTERRAVIAVLNAIPADPPRISEGFINASIISKEHGITRSVIASALKKLEGAGIISIRSLGMKGTHLTVLNPEIYTAAAK